MKHRWIPIAMAAAIFAAGLPAYSLTAEAETVEQYAPTELNTEFEGEVFSAPSEDGPVEELNAVSEAGELSAPMENDLMAEQDTAAEAEDPEELNTAEGTDELIADSGTEALTAPALLWVEPAEDSGIPARIDVFRAQTGGTDKAPVYTYQLYLPGNVSAENCRFSWDGGMQAEAGGVLYESGECPVPAPGTEQVYTFAAGSGNPVSFTVATYQGSAGVQPIFIDIDESQGTIAAMDGDPVHEASCTGRIFMDGSWREMSRIKGRGNYTWKHSDDKRAYNITLKKKTTITGIDSPATKKWTVLAEISDHSLLRTRTGFYLAHELGIGQDTASADIWMNGEYQGCYTLTPKYDSFVPDSGYLVENDNYAEPAVEDGGDPQFALEGLEVVSDRVSGVNLITVKKVGDDLLAQTGEEEGSNAALEAAAEEIRIWLQDAWDAIRSDSGYNSKGKYYTEYIDIESFAKMYLVQEYVKGYDICSGSLFFHRDGTDDTDKLIAGPLWDVDNALGSLEKNGLMGPAGDLRSGIGSFIPQINEYKTSIYKTIKRHEDFREQVRQQYEQNRQTFDELENIVAGMAAEIDASARMNHIKVNDLVKYNLHRYAKETVLEAGTIYEQRMLATTDSKSDWPNYAANLMTYVRTRSLWFANAGVTGIFKLSNLLKVKGRTVKVSYSDLQAGPVVLRVGQAIRFLNKGRGTRTYRKASDNKKISINRKTGKITLKKGLEKGTYKYKAQVKAAGDFCYKASKYKTVTITIKVK